MKDVLQTYKFNFEFNTKNAKKQLKEISDDVLKMLSDMDSASNKMKVFNNLVGYLEKLDGALSQFKNAHKDDFENMFGGLDTQLASALESAMGLGLKQLDQLNDLREKINSALVNKAGVKELRVIAQDINSLFASIGEKEPINIDEWFTGKGKTLEQRIEHLNDQLNDFYMSYQLITNSIKGGFGSGGASGFAALGDEAKQAAEQIKDSIKEINNAKKQLLGAKDTISKLEKKNSKTPADYKVDLTEESIRGLTEEFDRLNAEIASGDSSSKEYYHNLAKMADVVIKLKGALKDINADDSIKKLFVEAKSGKGDSMFGYLSEYVNTKASSFVTQLLGDSFAQNIQSVVNKSVQDFANLIPNVIGSGFGTGKQSGSSVPSYSQLIDKLKQYDDIMNERDKLDEDDARYNEAEDRMFDIQNELKELFGLSKEVGRSLDNIFTDYEAEAPGVEVLIDQVTKLLGVTEQVESSASNAQSQIGNFLSLAKAYGEIEYMSEADVNKTISKLEEMKSELIELSEQGQLTTEDLNKINSAFDATEAHLKSIDHSGYKKLQNEANEFGNNAAGSANEVANGLETVEGKTHGVTASFQELVNYISKSGVGPKTFFESLESGTRLLDEELSSILSKLNLMDASGNMLFNAVGNGSINSGGMISDQYALIARDQSKYLKYAIESQPKLFEAEQLGANVGTILSIFTDEVNNVMYELQKKVNGDSLDFLKATDEQIKKLVQDLDILRQVGLYVDHNGDNVLYDQKDGFSFIDLASKSTWFTAGEDNSVEENIDKFLNHAFGGVANSYAQDFMRRVYSIGGDVLGRNIMPDYLQTSQSAALISGTSSENIEKEAVAHEQNTSAINEENQALKEQIELKKKAQSMTWKQFALDESLSESKNTAGILSLASQEKFWKSANYDKDIAFHSLSEEDAEKIIRQYFTLDERERWYQAESIAAKAMMETRILENDELRNAALNKLYHVYKSESHELDAIRYRNENNDVENFIDFLNREFNVYRGDTAPVLYGDEQKLSFSFDAFEASKFSAYEPQHVEKTTVIPKNTVGSLTTEEYRGEQEVFVPSDALPYLSGIEKSFEEFYDKLGPKMQKAIDNRFIQLEKDRVRSLIGDHIADNIEDTLPFMPDLLNEFKQGNVPYQIELTGDYGLDQLAEEYNKLPEIMRNLVAYYANLHSFDPTQQFRSKTIGVTGLLDAIVGDPTGVQQHVARLTEESKFNIYGQSVGAIGSETAAHQKNIHALQEEANEQEKLNSLKSAYKNVSDRLYEQINQETYNQDRLVDLRDISRGLNSVYDTDESIIAKGEYINNLTGEVSNVSDLLNAVAHASQHWAMDLQYVKEYLQQVYGDIIIADEQLQYTTKYMDVYHKLLEAESKVDNLDQGRALSSIMTSIEDVMFTSSNNPSLIQIGQYERMSGVKQSYSDLSDLIQEYEAKYQENLGYVHDYLKGVFEQHQSSIQQLGSQDTDDDYPTYSSRDYAIAYKEQSDYIKANIDELAKFYQWYDTLQAKINGEPINFLISADDPTLEEEKKILDTFNALKDKIREIAGMQLLETEDDKKKLQELKAEAVGLQNILRSAKTSSNTFFSYQSAYNMPLSDAIQMKNIIDDPDIYPIAFELESTLFDKKASMPSNVTEKLRDMLLDDTSNAFDQFLLHRAQQIANEVANVYAQTVKPQELFDTESGQLALFEGMKESADLATDSVEQLRDTINEVTQLPGQIGADEYLQSQGTSAVAGSLEAGTQAANALGDALGNAEIGIESMRAETDRLGDSDGVKRLTGNIEAATDASRAFNEATAEQSQRGTYTSSEQDESQRILQYYQDILNTVNRINALDIKIEGLKGKNQGGLYTELINQMQSEKGQLIEHARNIAQQVGSEFSNGIVGQKVDLSSARFFNAEEMNDINAFMSNYHVQTVLAQGDATKLQECINRLSNSFASSAKIGAEAAARIRESLQDASKIGNRLFETDSSGSVIGSKGFSENNQQYQEALKAYQMLQAAYASLSGKQETDWTAQEAAAIQLLTNRFIELGTQLDTVAQKQQNYFKGKTAWTEGQGPNSLITQAEAANKVANETAEVEQKLRDFANSYARELGSTSAVVTNFVQSADGIARLDFSVIDQATLAMRKFKVETGTAMGGQLFPEETTVNKFTSNVQEAYKQLEAVSSLMGRLGQSGVNMDQSTIARLRMDAQSLYQELAKGANADQTVITKLTRDAKIGTSEVEKLYRQMLNMQSALYSGSVIDLGQVSGSGSMYSQIIEQVKAFALTQPNATLAVDKFNERSRTLGFTLTDTSGQVTQFRASVDALTGTVTAQQIGIGQTASMWRQLGTELSGIGKMLKYAIGGAYSMTFALVRGIKQGVQSVRNIDKALTELKKVTDETDVAYKNFLQDASKTSSVIGSTVSAFTEATANFARLGYTMEESASMAEAAVVYKNVADGLDSVEKSTESIISTMHAFGIESDDAMGIVDRFNEIGNNFAITSAGIGDALQRSGSALAAAGNTIDESIALITAANTVVNLCHAAIVIWRLSR